MEEAISISVVNKARKMTLICGPRVTLSTYAGNPQGTMGGSCPVLFTVRAQRLLQPEWGHLTSATYGPDDSIFFAGFVDITFRVFHLALQDHRIKRTADYCMKMTSTVTAILWHRRVGAVFVGQRSGEVSSYLVSRVVYGPGDVRFHVVPYAKTVIPMHTNVVSSFHLLPEDVGICSISMDATIAYFDPHDLKVVNRTTGHRSGVRTVTYCATYGYLITGGFDGELMLWIVMSQQHSPFYLRDTQRPHIGSVTAIECPPSSAFLYTLDAAGSLKTWDLRSFRCVQTIDVRRLVEVKYRQSLRFHSLCTFHTSPTHFYLACGTNKKLVYYFSSSGEDMTPLNSTESCPIICGCHLASLSAIITVSWWFVRVWDDRTFQIVNSYSHLDELQGTDHGTDSNRDHITAFTTMENSRKYFVAYYSRKITIHSLSNGTKLAQFPELTTSIPIGLIYGGSKVKYLVVYGTSGCELYREGSDIPPLSLVRHPVSVAVYCNQTNLLVLGTEQGSCTVYNTALDSLWRFPVMTRIDPPLGSSGDVYSVTIIQKQPHPFLIISYNFGNVQAVSLGVGGLYHVEQVFCVPSPPRIMHPETVTTIWYDPAKSTLYFGTERGTLCEYSVTFPTLCLEDPSASTGFGLTLNHVINVHQEAVTFCATYQVNQTHIVVTAALEGMSYSLVEGSMRPLLARDNFPQTKQVQEYRLSEVVIHKPKETQILRTLESNSPTGSITSRSNTPPPLVESVHQPHHHSTG
eukprot:PhF_6_TR27186/c1_g2_i4/m.39923